MLLVQTKRQRIKIKDLFQRYNISNKVGEYTQLNDQVKVLTPIGYKNINYLFRTQKQQKIKILLQNGQYIKCGLEHKLYMRPCNIIFGQINSTYKKAKYIQIGDYIAIKNQNDLVYHRQCFGDSLYKFIKVKAIIKIDDDEQILYDMQIDEVHQYFANNILSHNSWFLAGIGAAAIKDNKKVLHYTLQLTDDYTYMRYDSILSGIPFQKLLLSKDKVKHELQKYQKYIGNLRVKYYPTKGASVGTLLNHIKQCQLLLKFKPDLVIIDYADLLKPQIVYDNSYHTIGQIYLYLRGLAGQLEVPVWSASQINRCLAITQKVIIQQRTSYNQKDHWGWYDQVQIGTVKQGQHIFTNRTENGFSKITKVYPIQKQIVYQIRLVHAYGPTIKCSKNHLFPVASQKDNLKSIQSGLCVGDKLWCMTCTDMWKHIIYSITQIGLEQTIDIEVEDGHLFFCNNILTHNSGSDKQVIDKEDLAQSFKKIQIADFAFSISRKLNDKLSQTARINIMKNRFGPDGLVYNADMDASIGKIDIYDSHTLNSVKTRQKMDNGNKVIASKISQRLAQLKIKQEDGE